MDARLVHPRWRLSFVLLVFRAWPLALRVPGPLKRIRRCGEQSSSNNKLTAGHLGASEISWLQVAEGLPGRTNKDCRKRWAYALAKTLAKGRWNADEDDRLRHGVQQHGYRWTLVSQVVGSRQADQCSRRWHESANPNISHERWTLAEDETLRLAVLLHGRNWTEIVERYFYNRTPIAARNHMLGIDYALKMVQCLEEPLQS